MTQVEKIFIDLYENYQDGKAWNKAKKEVERLLKVQRDKCSAKATHFANEKADSSKIFNYVNSTPIED